MIADDRIIARAAVQRAVIVGSVDVIITRVAVHHHELTVIVRKRIVACARIDRCARRLIRDRVLKFGAVDDCGKCFVVDAGALIFALAYDAQFAGVILDADLPVADLDDSVRTDERSHISAVLDLDGLCRAVAVDRVIALAARVMNQIRAAAETDDIVVRTSVERIAGISVFVRDANEIVVIAAVDD